MQSQLVGCARSIFRSCERAGDRSISSWYRSKIDRYRIVRTCAPSPPPDLPFAAPGRVARARVGRPCSPVDDRRARRAQHYDPITADEFDHAIDAARACLTAAEKLIPAPSSASSERVGSRPSDLQQIAGAPFSGPRAGVDAHYPKAVPAGPAAAHPRYPTRGHGFAPWRRTAVSHLRRSGAPRSPKPSSRRECARSVGPGAAHADSNRWVEHRSRRLSVITGRCRCARLPVLGGSSTVAWWRSARAAL